MLSCKNQILVKAEKAGGNSFKKNAQNRWVEEIILPVKKK